MIPKQDLTPQTWGRGCRDRSEKLEMLGARVYVGVAPLLGDGFGAARLISELLIEMGFLLSTSWPRTA